MEDITRTIARIIDGIRAPASDVRGRPLQQFIAGDHRVYLRNEAVTVTVATDTAPLYDVAKYGRAIYQ